MATTEARVIANRINAQKSTGPKSIGGKERSRANGLKHSLTGSGVVLVVDDVPEVERRTLALEAELAPRTESGQILVGQMATLSVRMERGARQEFASVEARVRHAAEEFDEARIDRAETLFDEIALDPRRRVRQLRRMSEGIDLLVEAWQGIRAGFTRLPGRAWNPANLVRAANLLGVREEEARNSSLGLISRAVWGEFAHLPAPEPGLEDHETRKEHARGQLLERIDEAIAELEEHRANLDLEAIEQDRAEAGARATFDPSREGSLARRYESEARRGFFKAQQEFRKVEAEFKAAEHAESAPAPAPAPTTPELTPNRESLGSCRERPSTSPRDPQPTSINARSTPDRPLLDQDGRPSAVGLARPGRS